VWTVRLAQGQGGSKSDGSFWGSTRSTVQDQSMSSMAPITLPEALDGAAGHQDAAAAGEQGVNV